MISCQIINQVLQSQNVSMLKKYNLTEEYFFGYEDEYNFIMNHYDAYGNVPDKATFIEKFQQWEFFDVTESEQYLISAIREEHLYNSAVPVVKELVEKLKVNSVEAVQYLLNKIPQLQPPALNVGVDIIQNAEERYQTYLERKSGKQNWFIPTGFPELDSILNGWTRGEELVVFVARTGHGKEQPLSAKILTPNGWTTMGEIRVGDEIFAGTGDRCRVTKLFPQGMKDVYRITFSDKTSAECGLDHLWNVKTLQPNKKRKQETITLREIIEGFKQAAQHPRIQQAKYAIDYVSPVEFNSQLTANDLPPYALGALLGDGCVTKSHDVLFTTADMEILQRMVKLLPKSFLKPVKEYCYRINSADDIIKKSGCNVVAQRINDYGLRGCKPEDKFIPKKYLYASVEERIELLRGLCDTDGYVSRAKQSTQYFATVSKQLAEDFKELVLSLGGRITIQTFNGSYKNGGILVPCQLVYSITFSLDINPYYTSRKANRWVDCRQKKHKFIRSIELVRQEESQCILVDHPEHTYITNDYTITHNSWILTKTLAHAWQMGYKAGYISPEMSPSKIGYRFDTLTKHFSNRNLVWGKDEPQYESHIKSLSQHKNNFIVATPKDFQKKITVSALRSFIQANKLDILGVDGITYLTDERFKKGDTKTISLTNISEDLISLSLELQVPILVVVQSNRGGVKDGEEDGTPELENIRDSDGIAQNATKVISLRQTGAGLELGIKKHRDGADSGKLVYFWDIDTGKFNYIPSKDDAVTPSYRDSKVQEAKQSFKAGADVF